MSPYYIISEGRLAHANVNYAISDKGSASIQKNVFFSCRFPFWFSFFRKPWSRTSP